MNLQNPKTGRHQAHKQVITESSGTQVAAQGGYGPDRQWLQAPQSGSLVGTIMVFAEDGITPLATGSVNVSAGKAYRLVVVGGG
jgi:hypothetical protein